MAEVGKLFGERERAACNAMLDSVEVLARPAQVALLGVLSRVGRYRTPSYLKSKRIRSAPAGMTPPVSDVLLMTVPQAFRRTECCSCRINSIFSNLTAPCCRVGGKPAAQAGPGGPIVVEDPEK